MKLSEKIFFDKVAAEFDAGFNAYCRLAGKRRVQRRAELFAKYCDLKPGLKTIEVGCGTGEYTRALLKYEPDLLATDLSFNMLVQAQMKLSGAEKVRFLVSDIENLPISQNSCDVVLGNAVLHHLELERALEEIFRIMKRGGRFAFSEPNMLNPQIFLQKNLKFIKRLSGDSPSETAFLRWDLKRKIEKAGFSKVTVRPFDFLHPYTPNFLIPLVNQLGMFLERTPLKEMAGSLLITGEK